MGTLTPRVAACTALKQLLRRSETVQLTHKAAQTCQYQGLDLPMALLLSVSAKTLTAGQ